MNRLSPLDEIQLRERHDPITIEARLEKLKSYPASVLVGPSLAVCSAIRIRRFRA